MKSLLFVLFVVLSLSIGCQLPPPAQVTILTGLDTEIRDGGTRGQTLKIADPRKGHGHEHTLEVKGYERANRYRPTLGAVGTWLNGFRAGIKTGVWIYEDGQGQDATISTWLEWLIPINQTPDSIVEKVLKQ